MCCSSPGERDQIDERGGAAAGNVWFSQKPPGPGHYEDKRAEQTDIQTLVDIKNGIAMLNHRGAFLTLFQSSITPAGPEATSIAVVFVPPSWFKWEQITIEVFGHLAHLLANKLRSCHF